MQATETLYYSLTPYIMHDYLLGKMNGIRGRINLCDSDMTNAVRAFCKTKGMIIRWLHDQLKNQPKVAWKDSIKDVIRRAYAA